MRKPFKITGVTFKTPLVDIHVAAVEAQMDTATDKEPLPQRRELESHKKHNKHTDLSAVQSVSASEVDMRRHRLEAMLQKGVSFDVAVNACDASMPQTGVYFNIVNKSSKKCLEVAERSVKEAARIELWEQSSFGNQRWKLSDAGSEAFFITSEHSGKCLTVVNGKMIVQQENVRSESQRWTFVERELLFFQIINKHENVCLSVSESSKDNGTLVKAASTQDVDEQKWSLFIA